MIQNIVIIGAGPVGLIGAIMLYKKSIGISNITILEKRSTYNRQQVVVLDKHTLEQLPFVIKSNLLQSFTNKDSINLLDTSCYVWPPNKDFYGFCDKTVDSKRSTTTKTKINENEYIDTTEKPILLAVKISKLEKELDKWIRKNTNIKIIKPIESMKLYANYIIADGVKHPYNILIGADGIHSIVRSKFFGNSEKLERVESYGLAIIFQTKNNNRVYRLSNSPNKKTKERQNRVRFFRQTDYSIYLALQLSPKEASQFTDTRKIPESLKPVIKDYLKIYNVNIKCKDINDCIVELALFPIDVYYAQKVVDDKGRRFLVGDAAMNTHFFTGSGLNTGVEMFEQLSNYLFKTQTYSPQIARNINIKKSYTDYYNIKLHENKNKILETGLNFDTIEKVCETKTIDELKDIAQKLGIPINLPKRELCYLFGSF